jgi:hypothetical protein
MTMRDRLIPIAALLGAGAAVYALAHAARAFAEAHAYPIATFIVAILM